MTAWGPDEMMAVEASRRLRNAMTCFVGIGVPNLAANLAKRTHAPDLVLIYESGCIGANPDRLPLSIGDGTLAEHADATVSVPELFNYWLQPGAIDLGFLGAAQIDRFANLNSTIIGGKYDRPSVRLPGAGGATEIATACREVMIVMRQTPRAFVAKLDFVTSMGFGTGAGDRARVGARGAGPTSVITDLGVLEPDPTTCQLVLTQTHPGITVDDVVAATGWPLRVADEVRTSGEPTPDELTVLRSMAASVRGALS